MTVNLQPRYDSRKSFYGKATVDAQYPIIRLYSYNTHVASVIHDGQPDSPGKAVIYGTYSQTTTRHIKEFLRQYGFKADSTAQIIKDYQEVK